MQPFPAEPVETTYAITVDPAHEAAGFHGFDDVSRPWHVVLQVWP